MSKGGLIIEDVVAPLLQQVADAKCLLAAQCSSSTHNGFSDVDELLQEIEKEVLLIVGAFQRQEIWVENLENEISIVAKHLDNILEDNMEGCQSGLQAVHKSIFGLREHATGSLGQLHCKSSRVGDKLGGGGGQCSVTNSPSPTTELHFPTDSATQRFEVSNTYEELIPMLQRCLLSLAIFPQDSIIEKRLLIHWWVGEGLVTPIGGSTAEEVGDQCIKDLISEGLILPGKRDHSSQVKHLKVEQWIREQVIILAMLDEAFSFNGTRELIEDLTLSPRACLIESPQQGAKLAPTSSGFNPDNFKTCFNVDRHNLRFDKDRFMAMKNAAVMQLGRWQTSPKHHIEAVSTEFLDWLADFKELSYLSLRGISNITKLPTSIARLTNLMILDLRACHNLENLPVEVTMLKKLTYLDVSECYLLDHMPMGLDSLTNLQVLKGFVIGNSTSRDPCRLWELASLKLCKLSVRIGRDSAGKKREFHELSKFTALHSLTITWGATASTPSNGVRKALSGKSTAGIFNLSPPPNLEKLDLRCFPHNRAPEWLTPEKFPKLQNLYIRGGRFRRLGVGTEFNSVQVLRLRYLPDFTMQEPYLREVFPCLRVLEVHRCKNLPSIWHDSSGLPFSNEK